MLKSALKRFTLLAFLVLATPPALASGFGRWPLTFSLFAQLFAVAPGLVGDYLRGAYYRLTLQQFGDRSLVQFGSFFAHPEARVGHQVYIGAYCILGKTEIGDGCQIASAVQVLSGRHQHRRNPDGTISGSDCSLFETVAIGAGCWIGAGAIVMANVGQNTTVGAGAVVSRPLPDNCIAVGTPARPVDVLER